MKKFVFALESVLKAKEVLDRQKVQELSSLIEKKNRAAAELSYLEERQRYFCTAFYQKVENGIPVTEVKTHYHYISKLREAIAEKKATLDQLKKDEAELRFQLMEIRKDKKMLETLKEKKFEEYKAELKAEDERRIDELVSFKETVQGL